jgi:hypothetical protein
MRAKIVMNPTAPEQPGPGDHAVTRALQAMARGEPQASEELLPLVYDELRRLAAGFARTTDKRRME